MTSTIMLSMSVTINILVSIPNASLDVCLLMGLSTVCVAQQIQAEIGAHGVKEAAGLRTKLQRSLQSAAVYQGRVAKLEAELESLQQQLQGAKVHKSLQCLHNMQSSARKYQSEVSAAHGLLP